MAASETPWSLPWARPASGTLAATKNNMATIGDRLRRERERLGLSQTAFAALAGASKRSQIRFEADERSPDASYLAGVAKAGVDVYWIITGKRR